MNPANSNITITNIIINNTTNNITNHANNKETCFNLKDYNMICFICLDEITNDKINNNSNTAINEIDILKNNKNKCNCKYQIHFNCLKEWFNINNYCPLCRKRFIDKNDNENLHLQENTVWNTYYNDNQQYLINYYEERRRELQYFNYLIYLLITIFIIYLPIWLYNLITKT